MQLTVRSNKEAVYDWILECVIHGELSPNDPLVIGEISRNLVVSPIPGREAFQQLQAEGFVVIRPYTGAVVADYQPSMIIKIYSFLEVAELISGRMACAWCVVRVVYADEPPLSNRSHANSERIIIFSIRSFVFFTHRFANRKA